jgi:hypothetical protein
LPDSPAIAVDSQGVIYVAWRAVIIGSGIDGVYLRRYACEDGEGEPIWCEVEPVPGGYLQGGPAIALVDQTVYVAFKSTDENAYSVFVARSPAMDEWTIDTIIGFSPSINGPALTADSQGNLYLAWSEQSGTDDIVYVARRDGDTGNWSDAEPLSNLGAENRNPHLAVGPLDNVIATWDVWEEWERADIYYSERPAGDAAPWSAPVTATQANDWTAMGDVVIDVDNRACLIYLTDEEGQDQSLQVRCAAQEDRAGEEPWEDWADVSDRRIDNGDLGFVAPSLAVGPDAHLYAAWSEPNRGGSGDRYIYFDQTGGPRAIKHYYASSQRLASRVDGVLYYTLPDPTGASLLLVDTEGISRGHILYDGYGGILSSTLTPDLEAALAGQGATPDPDTGLVYLGEGRFYDPALGRPLQPNPTGGPLALPQALNRYAPTPWGAPGVAEGAASRTDNLLLDTFEKSAFKTALTYFGFRSLQLAVVPTVPVWGPLSLRMSQYAWNTYYNDPALRALFKRGVRYQKSFYTWELSYRARQIGSDLFEVEEQGLLGIRRGTRGAKIEVLYDSYGLNPRIRFLSGMPWAFVLSFGVQVWSDWDDPYFTGGQKLQRGAVAGGEGILVYTITYGGAILLGLNPIGAALLGLGIGFVWFSAAHPWALETFGPTRERRLAPLP